MTNAGFLGYSAVRRVLATRTNRNQGLFGDVEMGYVNRRLIGSARSVMKLRNRFPDLSDVVTSLKVEFLSEVINRLLEAHIERRPSERYKLRAVMGSSS